MANMKINSGIAQVLLALGVISATATPATADAIDVAKVSELTDDNATDIKEMRKNFQYPMGQKEYRTTTSTINGKTAFITALPSRSVISIQDTQGVTKPALTEYFTTSVIEGNTIKLTVDKVIRLAGEEEPLITSKQISESTFFDLINSNTLKPESLF